MFGSAIFEVIVGMVFIYSLFSILVTQINTFISDALKLRSKNLYSGLEDLLNDDELRAKVIVHPLIQFAKDRKYLPDTINEKTAKEVLDSGLENVQHIKTETFVEALLDVVSADDPAVLRSLFSRMQTILEAMPEGDDRTLVRNAMNNVIMTGVGVETLHKLIADLKEPAYRHALSDALEDLEEDLKRFGLPLEGNIRLLAGLQSIKDPYMRGTLEALLVGTHNLENAQRRIGQWFDTRMDEASNAFKLRIGLYSILVGFLVSFSLNVDTLYIAQTLWNDPALRQAISTAAENADLSQLEASIGTANQDTSDETTSFDEIAANLTAINETADQISSLRLPMGWSGADLSDVPEDSSLREDRRYLWNYLPQNNPQWAYFLLLKLLGVGVTTVAIAQGAPFWFNLLRRLTSPQGGSANTVSIEVKPSTATPSTTT